MWQVEVLNRGVAGNPGSNLAGHNYLCLTKRQLSIVRQDDYKHRTDIALTTIRGLGSNNEFVYFNMGRMAVTGSGALWVMTQDKNIGANIINIVVK